MTEKPAAPSKALLKAKEWLDAQIKRSRYTRRVIENVNVTPALAELLLAANPNNRHLHENTVKTYAADMVGGHWDVNGESIKVAKTGELNDGQHRLAACIQAKTAFHTDMVFGLERDSRLTVDQGLKRTAGNIAQIEGIPDANNMAVAARILGRLERYGHLSVKDCPFTRYDVMETIHNHPQLSESLKFSRPLSKDKLGRIGMHTALHYMFAQKDRKKADEFYEKLDTGEDLRRHDPILTLRRKVLSERMNEAEALRYTVKTWNAFIKNRELQLLRLKSGEAVPDIEG